MPVLISNVSKSFKDTPVIKHLNASFPDVGFVSILGKSGCGKSTLLHCLGTLEKIDEGEITLDYKAINLFREKEKREYLNKTVSLVFQHYQLIENQSLIFNVSLPLLIAGERENYAFMKAKKLLKEVGFNEEKHEKCVVFCSGGEKQRVALCRAMINEPRIILADEPTGALDKKNSKIVMQILKAYSKNHLVIMVTHNEPLAKEYSDRIMLLKESKMVVETIHENKEKKPFEFNTKKRRIDNSWINRFITKNLKRRVKRNSISCISLALSLIFTFILFGFIDGSKKEIPKQSIRQFDCGVSTLSITNSSDIENSKLKLVQEQRPLQEDMEDFVSENKSITYGLNYDYLVPNFPIINYKNKELNQLSYNPIYSFSEPFVPNFLVEGNLPSNTLDKVIINKKAEEYLTKILGKSPLNFTLSVKNQLEVTTYLSDPIVPYVTDYFVFEKNVEIVGVVDELSFLNTPKIYYSFLAMDRFMESYLLNNLSSKLGRDISYKEKVKNASSNEPLSSYSYRIFVKDVNKFEEFENLDFGELNITNNSLTIREAINSFVTAGTMGMELFLGIALLGSVFILGITSFSSYSQDSHQNAILLSLGAKQDDIFLIYVIESMIIGMISFFGSLIISVLFSPLINNILNSSFGFKDLVQIPIRKFLGKSFFLPILMLVITLLVCVLSSFIPMFCSKKVSLSQELKEEWLKLKTFLKSMEMKKF